MSGPYTEVNDNVIDYLTIDCRASRRKGKEMSMGVCWFIRTLLIIDVVAVLMGLLTPLVAGADNIFVATGSTFLAQLLWAVGLHGDNMFLVNFTPFGLMWIEENAAALAQGTSIYELPHILGGLGAGGGLQRMMIWTAAAWPSIFLMLTSKVKYHKTLGLACLPPAIFTVVEPVVFGLPLALNPYLMIPFILSATVSMAVGYGLTMVGFFGRFFAALPWATPPFLLGPLGTGDIKTVLLPALAFVIGLVIYLPFWRAYEKHCLDEEAESEVEAA